MNDPQDSEKLRRLAGLTDEVDDFHPLLRTLLPKMPRVTNVEYTHGAAEMGADFLLSRLDDTFGTLDYVGIVAKLGKMDQESISEIDRQIEECFIAKLVNSGKDNAFVGEVWVVTTGSFTNNAKIKINAKYRGKKVVFIPRDKLVSLIDKHIPNFWTDVTLEIGEYLNVLRQRNDEAEYRLSLLKDHRDIYIEQDLYRVLENEYHVDKRRTKAVAKVDPMKSLETDSIILVEGEMGSGKSKLIRQLVKHYTTPQVYLDHKYLPVPLSYKTLIDKFAGDLDAVIKDAIHTRAFKEIGTESTYLFLIDAVDEKNSTDDERVEMLSTLVKALKSNPTFKAVITSRYLSSLEGSKEGLKGVMRTELRSMSLQKIIKFIQVLCAEVNVSKRIFEDLKKSPLFKQLPKTPIAAILLAQLLNENSQDLPSNLPELYTKYLELMLGRWDMDKGLQSQKEYEALDNVMMLLSKFILENELNYISVPDAKGIVEAYLKRRNLSIEPDKLFNLMIERCEILNIDPYGNRLSYKHRTFAEYFYAKSKIRGRDFVIDNRAFQLYWSNVFYFFVGILKDCPDVLEELTKLEPASESEKVMRLVNMANYYMAGFASPYDTIERGIVSVMRGAAEYYHGVVTGRDESTLARYSQMQLLWMFQVIVRQSYSFEFFTKALENAALEIAGDEALPNEVKGYALFLLNVTYIDATGKESFDFILKDYAKFLPLSVQMAIHHESEDVPKKSALMRKQDRSLRSAIRGNRRMHALLDVMYKKPIKSAKTKR